MTENKITTYTFTYEDYKLLHSILPTSPCSFCIGNSSCYECPDEDKYEKAIKPYKDNGIYEFATILKTADDSLKNLLANFNSFFGRIDELKECCKYMDKDNSTDISPCDVDIPENIVALQENNGALDIKLFYLFLDSLGLNYSQYEMLQKVYEMLSKIKKNQENNKTINKFIENKGDKNKNAS